MNAMNVIFPYKLGGIWMFDDHSRELVREPFVGDANVFMDSIVASVPNAESGFRLLFSERPFPGVSVILDRSGNEFSGFWYDIIDSGGAPIWLCPALLKYFKSPPNRIYVKAEAMPITVRKTGDKFDMILLAPDTRELYSQPYVGGEKITVEVLASDRFRCLTSSYVDDDYRVLWGDEFYATENRDGRFQLTELIPNENFKHFFFDQGMNVYGGPPDQHEECYDANELQLPVFEAISSEGGCLEYGDAMLSHFLLLHGPARKINFLIETAKGLCTSYWSFSEPVEILSGDAVVNPSED